MTEEWREDCLRWHGRVLYGLNAHWCNGDWDGLPIDETCWREFMCCTCRWKNSALQARAVAIREMLCEVADERIEMQRYDMWLYRV